MSDTRKEKPNAAITPEYPSSRLREKVRELFVSEKDGPRSLAPVRAHNPYNQLRTPMMQPASWWSLCNAWLRYHYIQWRWDVERAFARLLRRRWT
jgi:hypothetical protein